MQDRLLESPWALHLDPAQRARVEQETQVLKYPAGSVICPEGVPAQHWVGVLDGMVKVDTVSADGRGTTFIGVTTGGWLGEGSLLKRELRPYEVVTLRESWIALMPLATFEWLFQTSLPFNHFLVRQLNARLGQFVAVVESCRIQSPTAQVAVCVAELFNPTLCSATSDVLRISQEEIARLCGLSRQIAHRALHELEQAGLVKMKYGTIHVLDVDRLHAFGRGMAPVEGVAGRS
ncbi:Crp/Fnr family transcriptional regulator [Ramlibacter sp. WS9]|uniref:Crp/Fnr family transcriptional regulator n=1 Tax=Ramlibacter sp. WS9 TaxID=1882741 RepID=UPI001E332B59|nr:Crp/Fnr family transcriptional regulator [Ramlibacter sp. WS9]